MDSRGVAKFEDFEFNLATRELRRGDRRVRLAPQPARVLAVLLEHRDELVTREALKLAIWRDDTFVEFDQGLTYCIKQLRAALQDDAKSPRFIETIPKGGYRFVAPVTIGERKETRSPQSDLPPVLRDDGSRTEAPRRRALWRSRWVGITAVAAVLVPVIWLVASRTRPATAPIESLVVLPFANLSGQADQEYLADSLTDALITSLGQVSGLRVISRTSALTYKGRGKTVPQIARELNVDAVVEGTVQHSADRVRLTLKLIQGSTDRTVWAQSYEHGVDTALDLSNEIARAIVSRTTVTLTPRESARLAEPIRVNPKAYEAWLKGRYLWNRRSEPDMKQAIAHFEEAIRLDPGYAPAFAGLADSYALYGSYGWPLAGGSPWSRALAAANKALTLDERLADAHTSRARIALNYELDWAGAGRGYRRALELNPGYANAHHWYGYYLMLSGKVKEGEAEMRRALELDPLSPIINANIGMCFYVTRQYDAAIAHWQKVLEMHRNYRLLHDYMTGAYIGKGLYREALAELEKSIALSGAGPWEMAIMAYVYGRTSHVQQAEGLLAKVLSLDNPPGYFVALAYTGMGDNDEAFKWLDRALQERSGPFNELNADPLFDSLRTDPRFGMLLRRMGLPTAPKTAATS